MCWGRGGAKTWSQEIIMCAVNYGACRTFCMRAGLGSHLRQDSCPVLVCSVILNKFYYFSGLLSLNGI